jgi:protein-disulfide isomerase
MLRIAWTGKQWGIAVVGLAFLFAGASALYLGNTDVRPASAERDHIFGNPGAEMSLIEYSDFECPFCKRFHETAKQVVQRRDIARSATKEMQT